MNELTFRVVSLLTAVAYMTVRTVHERRLGRATKAEQMRTASPRERRDLMIVGVGMLPMWLYMLTPYFDFARMGLSVAARLAGLAAAVLGALVLAASHRALGASWSPFGDVAPAAGLVTGGVYRFLRHPMYASFFLFNLGMLLLTSNWLSAPAVLGMLWLYLSRVDGEERMMLGLFGESYRLYAERTGRVFPGVGRRRLAGKVLYTYATHSRPAVGSHHGRMR